jgi:hypothetical protein
MKTESSIEIVFEHVKQRYVVEYDLTYDSNEFYVDVVRIEALSGTAYLNKDVVLQALEIAQEDGESHWTNSIMDVEAVDW